MKQIILIGARLLTAYFVALPLLVGLHAELHGHTEPFTHDEGMEQVFLAPDCDLCDLYDNQDAVVAVRPLFQSGLPLAVVDRCLYQSIFDINSVSHRLRGPPTA